MSKGHLNSRDEDEEYFSANDGRDISPAQSGDETSLAEDGDYCQGEQTCGAVRTDAVIANDSNECAKTDAGHVLPPFVNAARHTAVGRAEHVAALEPGRDDLVAATDPTMETRPPAAVGNSSSSNFGYTVEPGGLKEPTAERQEAATNAKPEGFSEVGRGCIETGSEANGELTVENSRTENTAGTTANKVDKDHAVASFGAFSVSCLKLGVAEVRQAFRLCREA